MHPDWLVSIASQQIKSSEWNIYSPQIIPAGTATDNQVLEHYQQGFLLRMIESAQDSFPIFCNFIDQQNISLIDLLQTHFQNNFSIVADITFAIVNWAEFFITLNPSDIFHNKKNFNLSLLVLRWELSLLKTIRMPSLANITNKQDAGSQLWQESISENPRQGLVLQPNSQFLYHEPSIEVFKLLPNWIKVLDHDCCFYFFRTVDETCCYAMKSWKLNLIESLYRQKPFADVFDLENIANYLPNFDQDDPNVIAGINQVMEILNQPGVVTGLV